MLIAVVTLGVAILMTLVLIGVNIHAEIENHRCMKGVVLYRELPDGSVERIK